MISCTCTFGGVPIAYNTAAEMSFASSSGIPSGTAAESIISVFTPPGLTLCNKCKKNHFSESFTHFLAHRFRDGRNGVFRAGIDVQLGNVRHNVPGNAADVHDVAIELPLDHRLVSPLAAQHQSGHVRVQHGPQIGRGANVEQIV
uniref:Uncharacterized protein n=1 Tax=Anopheles culicifacies TaxID=139723 RepID=A0A182MIK3_9DIPT